MDSNHKPEQCRRFRQTQWQLLDANASATSMTELETEPCLDGWIYDQSVFKSTIVTEWDLVCDFRLMKSLSQAIYMTGLFMGLVTGIVSDRAGRQPVLLLSCLLSGAIGTCYSFAPTFPTYCVLRFLLAAFVSTVENISIVFGVERSNSKWRPTVVAAVGFAWSAGQALLGGLAYVFRDWYTIQLFISVPYLVCFLFLCGNVESAQWLIATGKTELALKELQKVAWINGKKDIADSLTIGRPRFDTHPMAFKHSHKLYQWMLTYWLDSE
ncbi:solute carrier family 22 member 22-like [Echinops telfairi]|uniref:Solute carrier family 22 member 22-like n=1 Tax=Echinops telfairi TaxID=9371 RepID=A0AC55CU13_ECHTE|nr:solute carrier family 22 member 22-like [Echinops telfairi]